MKRIQERAEKKEIAYESGTGKLLAGCILLALLICFLQIRGNRMLLTASLLGYLLFSAWACKQKKELHVLLFFLPWSPLLKLYSGSTSFFTIGLLLMCLFALAESGFVFRIRELLLPAAIAVITMIAKVIQGGGFANSYWCFLLMLLLFPSIIKRTAEKPDFLELTCFFAAGIILAALSAQQAAAYPNISQYIKVDSYLTITRLSGYYGDPNFYSAHINACLAGIMILLVRAEKKYIRWMLGILAIILLYCGLLSASKSFVVILIVEFLAWIPILFERQNRKVGFQILAGLVLAVLLALSTSAFQSLLAIVDTRFSYASNLSEFTTGRTELWMRYLTEFTQNPALTIFGEGYTDVTLYGRASHNSIIQGIYQFGVIGFPLLLVWLYSVMKAIFEKEETRQAEKKYILILCAGIVLPWMALDILFFDEFFLLSLYGAVGIACAARGTHHSGQFTE